MASFHLTLLRVFDILAGPQEDSLRLAFSTLGCPDWQLDRIAASAVAFGYNGVEIRGIREHVDLRQSPHFSKAEISGTRRVFEEAGLDVVCLGSSASFADPEKRASGMDEALGYIEIAMTMGCPLVRVFGGNLPDGTSAEYGTSAVAECLAILAVEAEASGVKLALETHDAFSTGASVAQVLKQVNHQSVGALWDLHHPYCEGEQPQSSFGSLEPFLLHTHVKDSRHGTYCLLGEGDIPVSEMLDLIKNSNHADVWVSLEWEKRWHPEIANPEIAFPQYAEMLRRYMEVDR
jgi:sugar phosphate isomerase/epimerase